MAGSRGSWDTAESPWLIFIILEVASVCLILVYVLRRLLNDKPFNRRTIIVAFGYLEQTALVSISICFF